MLYTNKNGVLTPVQKKGFKLERELQHLVEKNLDILFGLEFLTTEFSLNNFRFDSVAYSEENKAFVIIEYKRGSNESLVDQGYAYLNTVLDRKSDLVLLYNNKNKCNKNISDFEWPNTRVYFISTKFTDYQKVATGYTKMPFSLFEVSSYSNGDVIVNEINENKIADDPGFIISSKNDKTKEICVYTEEDLTNGLSESLKEVYENLKDRILTLENVSIKPTKLYIAFKVGNTNICDIEPFKKFLKVFINMPVGSLKDFNNMAKDVSSVGHHGNGDYAMDIKNIEDIDYLFLLIRQAYNKNV